MLNTVTGVCGLAAMLWLYGVAWHQPMAQSIAWARTSLTEALPSAQSLFPSGFSRGGVTGVSGGIKPAAPAAAPSPKPVVTPPPAAAVGTRRSGSATPSSPIAARGPRC